MNIYQEMVKAGVEITNHESDLYAKVTPESEAIVKAYEFKSNVRRFINNIDGLSWFDIPFAFSPYWIKRQTV